MKFGNLDKLFGPVEEWSPSGGGAPVEPEPQTVEVDDYDPAIHDDPENPEYRGPDWQPGQTPAADPTPAVNFRQTAPAGFDPDMMGDAIARGLTKAGAIPAPQKQQITEEDFRKTAGWKSASPEEVTELFNPDTTPERKLELLNGMLTGAQTYATNVARGLHHDVSSRFDQYTTQQQEQLRVQAVHSEAAAVTTMYPALKQYGQHLPKIFESLRATGYRPKSVEEGRRVFASYAMQTIRQFVPNFSLQSQKAASVRPMAGSVNNGGSHGTSRPGKKPDSIAIWD
jgi:hypothetical protein